MIKIEENKKYYMYNKENGVYSSFQSLYDLLSFVARNKSTCFLNCSMNYNDIYCCYGWKGELQGIYKRKLMFFDPYFRIFDIRKYEKEIDYIEEHYHYKRKVISYRYRKDPVPGVRKYLKRKGHNCMNINFLRQLDTENIKYAKKSLINKYKDTNWEWRECFSGYNNNWKSHCKKRHQWEKNIKQ